MLTFGFNKTVNAFFLTLRKCTKLAPIMAFKKTQIVNELQKLKSKSSQEERVMEAVRSILQNEQEERLRIAQNLETDTTISFNDFNIDLLEHGRVYHLEQIKDICIAYRLRFLDSRYFKGAMPEEAINQIKKLERQHCTQLKGFKIMAPSRLFKLEDKDDPLLFAPLGNDYYYLVHQWGNDLHPLRKLLVWPLKNLGTLAVSTFVLSLGVAALIPEGLFTKSHESHYWIIFLFTFKSIIALVVFYGVALGKNVNQVIWNSKYFNA